MNQVFNSPNRCASISDSLVPNPTNAINCNDPLLTSNHANAPQMKVGADTFTSSSVALHPHWAMSRALLPLPPSRKICACDTNLALLSGGWLPLNNKTGNFLCPGNVPLVINVILISRPQCNKERPQLAQDLWGTIAKCFLHFFPLPWIQSLTFTGRIQSGHLSDSPARK